MNTIIKKPCSFSLSLCFLILGGLVVIHTEFFLVGMLFAASSFFIFMSFAKTNHVLFKVGQCLIYLGILTFYSSIGVVLPMWFHLLFFMAAVMFHLTLRYVLASEYK